MLKRIKFEKSKYPIFKIAFFILIFCSLSMIFYIAKINFCLYNIKNIGSSIRPITLNIKFNKPVEKDIFICFNDYCKVLENNSTIDNIIKKTNIYSVSLNENDEEFFQKRVKNIYFAHLINKNTIDSIESIVLYIGNDYKTLSKEDIKNSEFKTSRIKINNDKEAEYKIYKIKNSSNIQKPLRLISIFILSFVYNWNAYIIPFSWLFVAILIFLFNKDAFNMPLKKKSLILFLSIVLFATMISGAKLLTPKESQGQNNLIDFVLNDIKNYKDYEINILSNQKDIPDKLKNQNINWHFIELKDNTPLNKIDKYNYTKNKNALLYFDSNTVNVDIMTFSNAKMHIIKSNYLKIGKIILNKEQK